MMMKPQPHFLCIHKEGAAVLYHHIHVFLRIGVAFFQCISIGFYSIENYRIYA